MSFKAKDLHYDHANEPAFLRRLREQNSGRDDRHERAVPRPKRIRTDEEEDAPTYVDESNDTLTKAEYEALISADRSTVADDMSGGGAEETALGTSVSQRGDQGLKVSGVLPDAGSQDEKKPKQIAEAALGTKKRKVAKVVGDDDEEQASNADEPEIRTDNSVKKKAKKKGKPIKLSFDDDEDK